MSGSLDARVDAVLTDPLAQARAALAAIGYVGFDLPEDLLAAFDGVALHLPWDADMATPRADAWLEPSFQPWAHSILEQWADGAFDFLARVIFSRGNDTAQRLYYYICELQRRGELGGPTPLILDLAYIPRTSSVDRSAETIEALAAALGLHDAALERGIAVANHRRSLFADLARQRAGAGARHERIGRAALFAALEGLTVEAEAPDERRRVLLAGSPPPDDRLHAAIERGDWMVAGELSEMTPARLGPPINGEGAPAARIALQLQAPRFGPRSFADPAIAIVEEARRVRAEAVVLWLIEQEESIVWHVPAQVAALKGAGLPVLILSRRRWDGADGAGEEMASWLEGSTR
jgi:hypothetical protein